MNAVRITLFSVFVLCATGALLWMYTGISLWPPIHPSESGREFAMALWHLFGLAAWPVYELIRKESA